MPGAVLLKFPCLSSTLSSYKVVYLSSPPKVEVEQSGHLPSSAENVSNWSHSFSAQKWMTAVNKSSL